MVSTRIVQQNLRVYLEIFSESRWLNMDFEEVKEKLRGAVVSE